MTRRTRITPSTVLNTPMLRRSSGAGWTVLIPKLDARINVYQLGVAWCCVVRSADGKSVRMPLARATGAEQSAANIATEYLVSVADETYRMKSAKRAA